MQICLRIIVTHFLEPRFIGLYQHQTCCISALFLNTQLKLTYCDFGTLDFGLIK